MRDYRAETKDRLNQVADLLRAWIGDLEATSGESALHDKLVVALASARSTLEMLDELPRAPKPDAAP